jgi:hypothetical protein
MSVGNYDDEAPLLGEKPRASSSAWPTMKSMKSIAFGALCVTAAVVGTLATHRLGHGRDVASLGEESSALGYGDAVDLDQSKLGLVLTENYEALAKSELGYKRGDAKKAMAKEASKKVSDGASKAAKKVCDGAKKVADGAKKGAKKVSDGASFVNRKAGWLLNPPEWIFEWGDSHGLPVNGRSVKLTAKNHVNPLFLLNQKFPIGANPKFTGKQRLIGQYLAGPEFENATAVCPVGKDDKGKRWQPDKSFTVTFRKPGTPVGEEILKAYVQGIAHVLAPVPDMPPTLKVNDVAGWFVDKLEGSLVPAPFIPTAGKYAADTFTEKLFNYFAADTVITMTTSTVSSHKAKFGPNFFTLPCEISVQTIGNLLLQDKELMDKYPMEGTSKSKVLDYAGTYAEATVDFIMAPSIEKIAIEKTVDKGAKAVKAGAKAVKTGAKAATKAATKAVAGSKEKKAPR